MRLSRPVAAIDYKDFIRRKWCCNVPLPIFQGIAPAPGAVFLKRALTMNSQNSNPSSFRKQLKISLLAGTALVLAATGVSGFYAVSANAEAVRVESAQQQPGFGDVVAKVTPAVVSVRVKGALQPASDMGDTPPGMEDLPKDHPLYKFFHDFQNRGGDNHNGGGKPRRERMSAQGSGFFISEDGYLVTNNHVVDQGEAFTVVLSDGTEMDAKLIGKDSRSKSSQPANSLMWRLPMTARSALAIGWSQSAIRSASAAR
jgi:Trypsin-like peptidase domain